MLSWWRGQRARWTGVTMIVVATGLGPALTLADQRAASLNPWHEHLLLGGTVTERAHALAAHLREERWRPTTSGVPQRALDQALLLGDAHMVRVLSVTAFPGKGGAAIIGTPGSSLAAPSRLLPLAVPPAEYPLRALVAVLAGTPLPVPEPPPRVAVESRPTC